MSGAMRTAGRGPATATARPNPHQISPPAGWVGLCCVQWWSGGRLSLAPALVASCHGPHIEKARALAHEATQPAQQLPDDVYRPLPPIQPARKLPSSLCPTDVWDQTACGPHETGEG